MLCIDRQAGIRRLFGIRVVSRPSRNQGDPKTVPSTADNLIPENLWRHACTQRAEVPVENKNKMTVTLCSGQFVLYLCFIYAVSMLYPCFRLPGFYRLSHPNLQLRKYLSITSS